VAEPILALDVGDKRIGVAVSDPGGTYSFPVTTIHRTQLREDLGVIVELARERNVKTIVVGDPVGLNGHRGPQAQSVDKFCAALAQRYDGTIVREDERLTTAQATRSLIDADVSRKKRKGVVDQLAATLILDSYLSRRSRP
jgi:putative Holliday junction resolvase